MSIVCPGVTSQACSAGSNYTPRPIAIHGRPHGVCVVALGSLPHEDGRVQPQDQAAEMR
jgi:hypothetical protein